MALSDRERRLLAEMEAALATDDPRLQSTLSGGDTATLTRKAPASLVSAIALMVGGIAILFTGLIAQIAPVGVAGFIVILAGLLMVLRSLSHKGMRTPKRRAQGNFGARLAQRWENRDFDR